MPPRSFVTLSIMAIAVVASATGAASHFSTPVPCSDPRGCPDIVVDDLQLAVGSQLWENWSASDCAVQEGSTQAGLRHLLRFTFTTPNVGDGDLVVGAPASNPSWFEYSSCHDHYHFKEYADYRLWTPSGYLLWDSYRNADPSASASEVLSDHPDLLSELVIGEKRGFCIIDLEPASPNARGYAPPDVDPSDLPKYWDCDSDQGISRGWADSYLWTLDGQWVDVTDVAPGAYVLEAEVNAEHLYTEMSYANNRAAIPVTVTP